MKELLEQVISEILTEDTDHPYHAHVTSIHQEGREDNLITGFGKSKGDSIRRANTTNKIYHDIDDDEHVTGLHKHDVHFRVSQKAHDHLNSLGHDMETGSGRDGYEMVYKDGGKHLHFDWKNKKLSHASEVKHK